MKSTLVLACALLAAADLGAQTHKDTIRGFQFKPPKEFNAVALDPLQFTTVAKYQSDTTEYGGENGWDSARAMFQIHVLGKDTSGDAEGPKDALETAMSNLDMRYGYYEIEKEKDTTIDGAKAKEMYIQPKDPSLKIYWTVLEQDDGIYVFEGFTLANRFDKAVAEFSKAAKSFKRIEKENQAAREAELSQLDDDERFLQAQIDKLPPGWGSMRVPGYLFLYNAEKEFVKELADRIQAIRTEYERLYPPDKPIDAISIVRVCNSREEYIGYGGPGGTGGYWLWVARELVFFDQHPREAALSTLNHEAFHQYIFYFYGQLSPHSWYNEGHGDYFAGAKVTKSNRISGFGDPPGGGARLQMVKEAVRLLKDGKKGEEGAAAPLRKLMHYSHAEYYGSAGTDIGVCYSQGWSVVHMLREGKGLKPLWQRILPEYLTNLLAAREESAQLLMERQRANAEKTEAGSSKGMSTDPKDYYSEVDEVEVQNLTFDKTFAAWTDTDWEEFQGFWLKYVEKL